MADYSQIGIFATNYKCFAGGTQGFDGIAPINILIGRNNCGKSSLLDIVSYITKPYDISSLGHKGNPPKIFLRVPLTEPDIQRTFRQDTSGGGIPGPSHWSFGRQWANKPITIELLKDNRKNFVSLDPPLTNFQGSTEYQKRLGDTLTHPLAGIIFKRLRSERDIKPEGISGSSLVDENGNGATNIIENYINNEKLPSSLVETTLLNSLNEILEPDSSFSRILVQRISSGNWEVFFEEESKGRIALSQSGSGLKTILLVLIYTLLIPHSENKNLSQYIFGLEELENNLHPALQRRLFLFLRNLALTKNVHFFITTHSNVVIDLFSSDENAKLYHVLHNGSEATVRPVKTYIERSGILDDLDVRASDLLQSNGVIWVEGPSDRLYINRWIELYSNGTLREGAHYQCVFYGGRLLAHLEATPPEQSSDIIKILLTNRNCAILIDSDKKNNDSPINDTKERICSEILSSGGYCWITEGKEIENYIPKEALSFVSATISEHVGQFEEFSEYLEKIKSGEGKVFSSGKVVFAERVRQGLTIENIKNILNINQKMVEVISLIKKWNAMYD